MAKDTTVVIVNWNGARFLEPLLDSVLKENPAEIIVVDNDSADSSLEVLERYDRIKIIRNKENLGFGRAANQGIEQCTSPFVLLLNVDVEARAGALQTLEKFLSENQECAVVAPQLIFPDGRLQPSCRKFPTPLTYSLYLSYLDRLIATGYRIAEEDHGQTMEVDQPMGAALLLRKKALEETGLFDPQFSLFMEEVDLCERIKRAGWKIYYLPSAQMVHHAGGSTSQDWIRSQKFHFQNVVRYFQKRISGPRMIACKLLLSLALIVRGIVVVFVGRLRQAFFYWKTAVQIFSFP